ncbi:MAG: segregation/condensation protein A [Armatimonadetes bacterium]|nr:segregation/condensation protein A [Armatimonadota bacterium]MDW8121294.1 segregation/condensation protein A [Armatimonadota bacterium]
MGNKKLMTQEDHPVSALVFPQQPPPIPAPFTFHRFFVDLPEYQGPCDLLLWLMRREFIEPSQVSARQIAESFRPKGSRRTEQAEDLFAIACLAHLKSCLLLAEESDEEAEPETGEEESEAVARQALRRRGFQNLAFRQAAGFLQERLRVWADALARPADAEDGTGEKELVLPQEPAALLVHALKGLLAKITEPQVSVPRRRWTVPFRIRTLTQILRFSADEPYTFDRLCADCQSRQEIIITFLALLELIRRGRVFAWQESPFDPIYLIWRNQ